MPDKTLLQILAALPYTDIALGVARACRAGTRWARRGCFALHARLSTNDSWWPRKGMTTGTASFHCVMCSSSPEGATHVATLQ